MSSDEILVDNLELFERKKKRAVYQSHYNYAIKTLTEELERRRKNGRRK